MEPDENIDRTTASCTLGAKIAFAMDDPASWSAVLAAPALDMDVGTTSGWSCTVVGDTIRIGATNDLIAPGSEVSAAITASRVGDLKSIEVHSVVDETGRFVLELPLDGEVADGSATDLEVITRHGVYRLDSRYFATCDQ